MFQLRMKTFQELLRQTQKLSKPRPSPVLADNIRMRGPGVKEECHSCRNFIAEADLRHCSACDKGFHFTCVPPGRLVTAMHDKGDGLILVSDSHKVVVPGEDWCCGLCNGCNSHDEHIEATDRIPCDSMPSSQTTSSQKEATVLGSKLKKTTNIRGLKEVVQQEEANLLDSRSIHSELHGGKPQDEGYTSISNTPNSAGDDPNKSSIADGNLGEAPESSRRSKRGRILKGTGTILPIKRRRADYWTSRSVDAEVLTTSNGTTITREHITIASTDGRNLGEEAPHVDATSGSIPHAVEAEDPAAESVRDTEGVLMPSLRVQAPEGSQAPTVGQLKPTAVGDFRPEGTIFRLPSLRKVLNVKLSDSDEGLESVTMETDNGAESCASKALTATNTLEDILTENARDQTQLSDTELILKDKKPLVDKLIAAVSQSEESQVHSLNDQHGAPVNLRPGSGRDTILSINKDSLTSGASDSRPPGSDGTSGFLTGEVLRKEYCQRVEDNLEVQQSKLDDENFLGFEDAALEAATPALRPQEAIPSPAEFSHPAANVHVPVKVKDLGRPLEEMEMSSMDLEFSEPCQVSSPKAASTIFEGANLKRILLENPCKHSVEQKLDPDIETIATETQPKALEVVDQVRDNEHGKYMNTLINLPGKAVRLDVNKNGPQVADPVTLAKPVVPGLSPQVLNSPPLVNITQICISKSQPNSVSSLFSGFTSQSHGLDVPTPPVTPQFPNSLYLQSDGDGKDLTVAKPLSTRMNSVSLPTPCSVSSSLVSSPRTLASISKPLSPVCASPSPSLPQVQNPGASICEVDVSLEELDSQLTKLVSGLPVPPLATAKESPALAVVNTNAIVARPIHEQPSPQLIEFRPGFDVSSLSITKDLGRPSSMLDVSMSEKVSPEIMVDDSTKVDGGCGQSTDVKESSLEEEETASVNVLLVEDVKVCDICGNSGYEEALAVCSSCNEGAEHLYCMRTQLDSIPEGWCCETCQARQKAEGPKQTERFLVLSSSFSRSSSMNNRSKPIPIQGSSRSRLSDRLNHKKSRITPVRKSPSNVFSVQTPGKVLANDSVPFPIPERLAVEGTTCTPSAATVPGLSAQTSSNSVRPVLARDSSFKSGPDTGKVKFLSPSALANFSPSARASTGKPSTLVAPTSKSGTTQSGQVSNKSRFASLSSFSESNPPSVPNKVAKLTTVRSSGKSAADVPSFLLNSNSRHGNMVKTLGQSKSSREGGVSDGVSTLCQGREAFTPGQTSGSRLSGSMSLKFGKSASSSALSVNLRPWPDTPRPSLDDGKGTQRAPHSSDPVPPGVEAPTDSHQGGVLKGKQPAKVAHLGPLSSSSNWQLQQVGTNQNLKHLADIPNSDQRSLIKSKEQVVSPTLAGVPVGMEVIPLSDMNTAVTEIAPGTSGLTSGTGCAAEVANVPTTEVLSKPQRSLGCGTEVRQVSVDSASLVGSPGLQSGSEKMVRSAPWQAATSNTRCYKCKEVGHGAPDCPKRNSSVKHLEQKVTERGTSLTTVGLNAPELSKPNPSLTNVSQQKVDERRTSSTNVSPSAPVTSKESIPKFRDIDAHVSVVGIATLGSVEIEHLGATPDGCVQSVVESVKEVAETQPTDPYLPTNLISSPTSIDKNPVSFKIQNSMATSKIPSLVNSSSFQRLVAGHDSDGHSAQTNRNISTGPQTHPQKFQSNANSNDASEGPPGVCNPTETLPKDSKAFSVDPTNYPASNSPTIFYPPSLPQGHLLQPTDLGVLPSPHTKALSNRGIPPPWVPSPPWMDGSGRGAPGLVGLVGYPPPGTHFPPGPGGYTPPGPMPYLASPPPLPLLPPQFVSPPAPPPELATPNETIAWRGAFEVAVGQNTTLYDAIQAHTSTKAVSKVHEVARGMPQRLQLEQVARSLELETWPRQFNQRPPTDGSIALYFFATNGESFNRFLKNLVENMVTHDLVLRAQVDDAELLIFPSSKLPERCQRWMGHFFLWGVFRAKKQVAGLKSTSPSTEVLVEIKPGTERRVPSSAGQISKTLPCPSPIPGSAFTGEVDMEVDMEGGKDCGVADKAVKRPESTLLAPPTVASPAPTVESITSPVMQQLAMLETDPNEGKSTQVADEDLDLPPGFAPASQKSAPVSNLPPGFEKKIEALKQELLKSLESGGSLSLPSTPKVGSGNSADAETPDSGTSFQTRNLTSVEKVKSGNRPEPSPLSAPCPRETDPRLPAARPSTTKRSSSKSPTQPKAKEREDVRERAKERIRDREKGSRDPEQVRCKSRDQDRDSYRDRNRERDRSREKDRLCDHESSKERVRSRDRDKDKERDRERRRLPEREKPRDRRSKEGERDRDRNRRPRYKRSRSLSRSRSPGRQRVQSRSPPRRGRSRSPPRRYPSYHRRSISGSDSPDSRSRDFSRGALMDESRSRRAENGTHAGKRRSISEKDVGDKCSRPTSRLKTHTVSDIVEDTRSESAGASNSRTVATAEPTKAVAISRSITPVLDMNEGVSRGASGEGAVASTSLPDLNTQNESVESGVPFHDFLPADVAGPSSELETGSSIAEQTFFPGARPTVAPSPTVMENITGQERPELSSARERWNFAVASSISRPEFGSKPSAGYQFIQTSEMDSDGKVFPKLHTNPDLELALGGRERSPSPSEPLPLFVQLLDGPGMHGQSVSPELGFGFNSKDRANSPDLRVGLSTSHSRGSDTASLSLSLAVPQYRKEGNSWVKVEEERRSLGMDDVDFALTL